MKTSEFIVAAAKWYVGRTEKKGNTGFNDAAFEREMLSVGWYVGAPWCAFFGKLIWIKAYKDNAKLLAVVKKCCSGSALQTYKNFKADGTFEVGDEPRPGALVVWTHGSGPAGHEAVVSHINAEPNTMTTVEGNTNAHGSREGDCVAMKLRTPERPFTNTGLNVVGYVYPIEL
jgi:hypothetical protein